MFSLCSPLPGGVPHPRSGWGEGTSFQVWMGGGGGYPITGLDRGLLPHPRSGQGGTLSQVQTGVPHPGSGQGRVPHSRSGWGEYPITGLDRGHYSNPRSGQGRGGTLSQVQTGGYPIPGLDRGGWEWGIPSQVWTGVGYCIPGLDGGYPPIKDWMGYSPCPTLGWVPPPPNRD